MNMIKHTRALITLRERIHEDVEFHAKLECDMIDASLKSYLEKNKQQFYEQQIWLGLYRANTVWDKLKIHQYDYNLKMYKLQLKHQLNGRKSNN